MHREVIEVPEDSDDAKQWPRWNPDESSDSKVGKGSAPSAPAAPLSTEPAVASSSGLAILSSPATNSGSGDGPAQSSATTSKLPPTKRPGPRKPKTQLAALPTQKAKKLTTLDKSAMDWRAHVSSQQDTGLKDELDVNRRGGGYLEKVDFLQRVEERREDVFESNKSTKRRRG